MNLNPDEECPNCITAGDAPSQRSACRKDPEPGCATVLAELQALRDEHEALHRWLFADPEPDDTEIRQAHAAVEAARVSDAEWIAENGNTVATLMIFAPRALTRIGRDAEKVTPLEAEVARLTTALAQSREILTELAHFGRRIEVLTANAPEDVWLLGATTDQSASEVQICRTNWQTPDGIYHYCHLAPHDGDTHECGCCCKPMEGAV